jgi:hypothetical protein
VLGTPVRYEQGSREEDKQIFLSYGYWDSMAQSMIDMDIAKAHGIDNALKRTPENTTPTSFRQWAEEVLKPVFGAS